jgi:hypothetical protein
MSESLARTSAGIKLFASATAPATQDKAGFEGLTATWKEVGEITNFGEFGKTYNLVTHNPLGDRKTFKRKGSYNNGQLALQMALAGTDDGQAVLKTAVDNDNPIAFKVMYESGTVSDGADYFMGLVMSYTTNVGSVDQILGCSCNVEIDGDIVEVAKADT